MGLFDAIAQIVEEVVETTEAAAEAAVTVAQAAVDDAADAARDAAETTAKTAEDAAKMLAVTLNGAARGASQVAQQGQELVQMTADRVGRILGDPVGAAARGFGGVVEGMGQFGKNFGHQLKQGAVDWITGNFEKSGIPLPDNFDLRSLFEVVLDITGVTYERLRERAGNLFGDATNATEPRGGAAQNSPVGSRRVKGVVRGEVNNPAGQLAHRIHFLLDRQSIPRGRHPTSADIAKGDRTPVAITLGRRFVRGLFAEHLLRLEARSRLLPPTPPRSPRPMTSYTPHEPIVASGLQLAMKIRAINACAEGTLSKAGIIVRHMN